MMYSLHAQIELLHTPHPRPNPPPHDEMVHFFIHFFFSFLKPSARIYSFHAQIARPSTSPQSPPHLFPSPPTPLAFDQNQAPTSFKTPASPHRLFDLQDSLDKRIHFLSQLSDFVPLRNGFYSYRAQTA